MVIKNLRKSLGAAKDRKTNIVSDEDNEGSRDGGNASSKSKYSFQKRIIFECGNEDEDTDGANRCRSLIGYFLGLTRGKVLAE